MHTTTRKTDAIAPTPPARPSMVSSQFMLFIISTSQMIVAGTAIHAGNGICPPNGGGARGLEMLLIVMPNITGIVAHRTCARSCGNGPRRLKSSQTANGTSTAIPATSPARRIHSRSSRGAIRRLNATAAMNAM